MTVMLQSLKAVPQALSPQVPWDLQLKVLCLSDLRSEMGALQNTLINVMGLGVHEAWLFMLVTWILFRK